MKKDLMARAIALLSRREYSRRELIERLRPYTDSVETLEQVVDALAERSWQSDLRYAEQFSRHQAGKYGSMRLRMQLREKGISHELINQALTEQDDFATARTVWQRKFGTLPVSQQEKARQVRYLATRGFPQDIIQRILAGCLDDNE